MTQPPYLQEGDSVALVAPARKVSMEEMTPAINVFKAWGLNVVLGKNIFAEHDQYAGTDEQRISDLQEALDDENTKAIICARGGYGSMRIIDKLNFTNFCKAPKWIVGYSDITVFFSHMLTNYNISTLHATMPINFLGEEEAVTTLRNALFGKPVKYEFDKHALNRGGSCSGQLIGGNLSMLYALQGSSSDINTQGKILFLEDLDEYLYHVDRMMISLKRSGKLSRLEGLLVGGMNDMRDNKTPFGKNAYEIIYDAVKEYSYPVYFGFPAGHIPNNFALYIGGNLSIETQESKTVLSFNNIA